MRRIVRFLVVLPAVVILVALGVANVHDVRLALDPFRPADPALSIVLPFYAWLLAALIVGVVVGGLATWLTQTGWRRVARRRDIEVRRWRAETDRLQRERERQDKFQVSGVRFQDQVKLATLKPDT